jgi:hypothetical protein
LEDPPRTRSDFATALVCLDDSLATDDLDPNFVQGPVDFVIDLGLEEGKELLARVYEYDVFVGVERSDVSRVLDPPWQKALVSETCRKRETVVNVQCSSPDNEYP